MIYICVPAHNEEQTVGVVLWKVRQVMAELARDYQLLVADDGSTDRTPSVLEPYTRVLPLTVLRNTSRRGYAAALEMLLREAVRRSEYPRRDALVVLQADFTEDPQHVATLIRRIESGADIVASNMVYGDTLPRRAYRWGRALLGRLLRRFSWPEGARDPLTGLNAYRVVCVKRAIEERAGECLLRYEGWVANAELLGAAAPHARRIDTVDVVLRRERLQRTERFHFGAAFREVLAFLRRRSTATRRVEQLAPDAVIGGRSHLRALTVEGLREDGLAVGTAEAPQRRRGGERGGRGERSRPARGDKPQRGPRSEGTHAPGGRATKDGPDQARARGQKRRSRPPTPEPSPTVAEDGAIPLNGGEPKAGAEEPSPPRRSKPRRRSRRSGSKDRPGAPGPMAEGTPVVPEAGDPSQDDASADAAAEAGESQSARKRRRGSRGGRRRSRGPRPDASGDGQNGPTDESTPPPDAAAAG